MLICHLLIQPVPKFQESHTPQLAEINNQRNILFLLLVHNTFLRKNSQDWVLTCTLQDDGVLGKKRTVPLQQADLVMLAFKFTMDDLQIIAVRVTKPSGKYIVEKISIKRTNI